MCLPAAGCELTKKETCTVKVQVVRLESASRAGDVIGAAGFGVDVELSAIIVSPGNDRRGFDNVSIFTKQAGSLANDNIIFGSKDKACGCLFYECDYIVFHDLYSLLIRMIFFRTFSRACGAGFCVRGDRKDGRDVGYKE